MYSMDGPHGGPRMFQTSADTSHILVGRIRARSRRARTLPTSLWVGSARAPGAHGHFAGAHGHFPHPCGSDPRALPARADTSHVRVGRIAGALPAHSNGKSKMEWTVALARMNGPLPVAATVQNPLTGMLRMMRECVPILP